MRRSFEKLLHEYLTLFPCVAVIGPRQCGKTTLCKTLGESWAYYDLERGSDLDEVSADPELFLRLHSSRVVIDEAQMEPAVFAALRVAIDADRNRRGRFVVTGSSSPELLTSISESLAGRVGIIELSPLSYRETEAAESPGLASVLRDQVTAAEIPSVLKQKGTIEGAHEYWLKGGYPEPWLEGTERFRTLWMENYFRTYLMRDISAHFPRVNSQVYRRFIGMLAGASGTMINYSDVAGALGISNPRAAEFFEIAHGTFVWRTIPAFTKKTVKRVTRRPRGYLRDTGIMHFLLHIYDLEMLLQHPKMGHSWEALVVEEILRDLCSTGVTHEYSYYRAHSGMEVDLVLEGPFGLVPVEIKHASRASKGHLVGLNRFLDEFTCPFGIVVNTDTKVRRLTDRIIGIPFTFL